MQNISKNTLRPVKRLRVKDGNAQGEQNEGGGFANYFTTLRDGIVETPKREWFYAKDAMDKVTEFLHAGKHIKEIKKSQDTYDGVGKSKEAMQSVKAPNEDNVDEAEAEVEEDLQQAPESFAQADVRIMLGSSEAPAVQAEIKANDPTNGASSLEDQFVQVDSGRNSSHQTYQVAKSLEECQCSETEMDSPKPGQTIRVNTPIPEVAANCSVNPAQINEFGSELGSETPILQASKSCSSPVPPIGRESPQGLNSPQIGITLLRRESLRSRGSPRKKGSAQKGQSPERRHGLKKRDTLQEREILQQFNAAANPNEATSTKDLAHPTENTSLRNLSPNQSMVATDSFQKVAIPPVSCKIESPRKDLDDTQTNAVVLDRSVLDNKDLGRAVEGVEVCQRSNEDQQSAEVQGASPSSEARNNIDRANNFIARSEVQQAAQTIVEVCEKLDLSTRKTRSGARISDDTSMLKDFLNRAQAKKAAKCVPPLSAEVPKLQGSPTRRSPRKALEPQTGAVVSPQKSKKSTKGPNTPPRKVIVEDIDSSDDQEAINEPASFRRSTRTRLPAPSKTPPGAPSFIPVRRGDGSDQVVLQKSQAQEMAIVTRANTRRNKGQSKPPALALQDLPPESPVKMTAKDRADRARKVAWAEKLASYRESRDTPEEPDDQRPKVRRLRGLGAVHGTPAKKATAAVPPPNGTPAPKRRSKKK